MPSDTATTIDFFVLWSSEIFFYRLEEALARNRVKERKARTHRLIKEGAVLEKVLPEIKAVGLENLEEFLQKKLL